VLTYKYNIDAYKYNTGNTEMCRNKRTIQKCAEIHVHHRHVQTYKYNAHIYK